MSERPTHALDRHVALIGFMGAGKTTLGERLAEMLERPFVDLDAEIENVVGAPIAELFAERGEGEFRTIEEEVARTRLDRRALSVIALGGGAVLSEHIRAALRESAFTIWLDVDPNDAWSRVRGSDRPLAQSREQFDELFKARETIYEQTADARARAHDEALLAAAGIHVESGALDRLGELVPGGGRVALVTDEHVAALYGDRASRALGDRLLSTHRLPAGEEAKSFACYETLLGELRLERGDLVVALGGGCTTDVAGFAAATYMRGVRWVAVPTTLVGQADAAIGGKTAINLATGKNLVGAFHWPARVVADPGLLETLSDAQRREGMAEVVKTGLLSGRRLWEKDDEAMVRGCAVLKARVCLGDPHEKGARAQLNLGHTFAHALEAAGSYGRPTHGEAVALGLRAALGLSVERGLDPDVAELAETALRPELVAVDRERAWAALFRDKKVAGGTPKFVLLEALGKPVWGVDLPEDEVRAALDRLIATS